MFISGSISPFNWLLIRRARPGAGNKQRIHCPSNKDLSHRLAASDGMTGGRKPMGVSLVDRMGFLEIVQRKLFHPKSFLRDITHNLFILYTARKISFL